MRDVGDGRQVDDVAGRVADGLAEDRFGPPVDQCPDRLRPVVRREADLDSERRKHVREVGVGGSVELRDRHEVVAGADEVEDRHADRGRAGADRHRGRTALERGYPLLEHVDRRVVQAVVVIAGDLEVHDPAGMVGVDEIVRDRLVDRDRDCARGVRRVAAVDREGLVVHVGSD